MIAVDLPHRAQPPAQGIAFGTARYSPVGWYVHAKSVGMLDRRKNTENAVAAAAGGVIISCDGVSVVRGMITS